MLNQVSIQSQLFLYNNHYNILYNNFFLQYLSIFVIIQERGERVLL